jgi:transcriptional regulator with XRE-family HTH domain
MSETSPSRTGGADSRDPTDGPDGDDLEQAQLGARLREAREYIGLLQEDVATALGIPRTSVHALEAGKRKVTGLELRRLARLYRRPVGWLLGEEEIELNDAEPLFRATSALSEEDKEQVLRFAEFLAAAGKPGAAGGRRARRGVAAVEDQ